MDWSAARGGWLALLRVPWVGGQVWGWDTQVVNKQDPNSKPEIPWPSWARFDIEYLTFAILLAAFALRVYRLDFQSIWWDEGHSILMASAPLAQIPTLPGMDVHPPGYFAFLHQWMAVAGQSEFALRYLSVVFSTLTVALLMRFGRTLVERCGGRISQAASVVAGGLAALSPMYVAYAQEVRMYAAVTFFALASVYFQWRILLGGDSGSLRGWRARGLASRSTAAQSAHPPIPQPWLFAGYVSATAASLYTHYFTVFLLMFQNLAWLVWALRSRPSEGPRWTRMGVWFGSQLATLLLFAPQIRLALRQTVGYANPNLNPPGFSEFISRSWMAYLLGTAVDRSTGVWLAWALAAILGLTVLFQVLSVRQGPSGDRLGTVVFLAGWFLIPLAAYFLVLQRRPSFEPRYMMLVTPALMMWLAWALTGTGRRQMGWGGTATALVLASFAWGTWSYFTNVEAYKDDSAGVAAWLATTTTPRDIVYVDVPHPFHYYAERIPAPTRYLFVDVHTAADVLNAEAAGRDRLYWVTWWGSDTDPRGVIPFLLDKAGRRGGELDFRGYHVAWWELPIDARFSLPDKLLAAEITFDDVVRLDGLAFSHGAQAGGSAWATLHFRLLRDTDEDYRVSLRLRGPRGDMLPSTDKDLLNDRHFRTSAWPLDDPRLNQGINVYTLPVPTGAPPGNYCLEVVVYEATTLEALPLVGVPVSGCISPTEDGISARLGAVAVSPR